MVTRNLSNPLRVKILHTLRVADEPLTTIELARAVGEQTDAPSLRRLHHQLRVLEQRGLIEVERNGTGRGHANTFRAATSSTAGGAR